MSPPSCNQRSTSWLDWRVDPEEDHDRHGSEPLKPIYGLPTSAFRQLGIKRRITLIGVNSWTQLCSILGHATDDDNVTTEVPVVQVV